MLSNIERRRYPRLTRNFRAKIRMTFTSAEVEGVTENISQVGAFISGLSWPSFQAEDKIIVRLFLPPEMTGQPEELSLEGPAVVKRVEQDRGKIAVEFSKKLRAFEVL
jgi:hypothetical protein